MLIKPKIFGLDRCDWSHRTYVVEGPLDSLFVDNCLAVAGADFEHHFPMKENVTIILDNEPRSREIIKRMEKLIDKDYELVIWPDKEKEKDINDMVLAGDANIMHTIKSNTYTGLTAKLKLSSWKLI